MSADTNQASEDIFAGLDKISGYNRLLPTVKGQPEDACNVCGLSPESLKEAIQSLIRTEKLKLLAEVRERVIGENQHSEHKEWDCPCGATHSLTEEWHATNRLRDEQREALTKLEAEL